jgi:hypothetical protein
MTDMGSAQQQVSLDNINYSVPYDSMSRIILRARRIHVATALVSIVKSAIVIGLGVVFLCAWILRDVFLWELLTLFILGVVELVGGALLMIDTRSYVAWSRKTSADYAVQPNMHVQPIKTAVSHWFLEMVTIVNILFLFTLVITAAIYIWTTRFADGAGYMILFILMFALAATSIAELVLSILLITHRVRITTLHHYAIDVAADSSNPYYGNINNNSPFSSKVPVSVRLFLIPRGHKA